MNSTTKTQQLVLLPTNGYKYAIEKAVTAETNDPNDDKKDSMILFLIFMSMFTMIYLSNALLKLYLFCVEKRQTDFMYIFDLTHRSVKRSFFW